MKILQWLRNNRYVLIVLLIGLFFVTVYAWFQFGLEPKFNSPDETANYFFTKRFADTGQLSYEEPLNYLATGLVRPRSTVALGEDVAPASFLGIIVLYGLLAKVFGLKIILYLTPIISAVGVIFFFLLIKEIFNNRIAFLSSLLMFIFPVYWYYSSRGMFHHILFLTFLIAGLYYLLLVLKRDLSRHKLLFFSIFSGLSIGLSLFTRMSELTWVVPVVFVMGYCIVKKIGWKSILPFSVTFIVIITVTLLINASVYGSLIASGYSLDTVDTSSLQNATSSIVKKVSQLFFPFGFNAQQIGSAVYTYLLKIFPWFSSLFVIGLIILLSRSIKKIPQYLSKWLPVYEKLNPIQRGYFILFFLTSTWLVVYYGSFVFSEHIDPDLILLGSSYLRYWLPVFVFGLPLCSIAIIAILNIIKRRTIRTVAIATIFGLFYFLSINITLLDPLQGLGKLKENSGINQNQDRLVSTLTNSDSVIIAGHADKVFFPTRRVIAVAPSQIERGGKIISKLLNNNTPVYYLYNPLDSTAEDTKKIFRTYGISLQEVRNFSESDEVLYELRLD